jgi:hypothetical protein
MRQGTQNLNVYELHQGAITKIMAIPSTDLVYTSQIV